jgi:hypothetical protein
MRKKSSRTITTRGEKTMKSLPHTMMEINIRVNNM